MKSIDTLDSSSMVSTVEICRNRLSDHYRDRLKFVVLYGSAARQEMTEGSDIDLLVVLSQPLDYFAELRAIVELLYPIQLEASHWISAKPADAGEFEAGTIQLYRNALREGIYVMLNHPSDLQSLAAKASRSDYDAILANVPDVPPEPYNRLPIE